MDLIVTLSLTKHRCSVRGHILHTSMTSNSYTGLSVFNDAQEGFRPEAYGHFG